MITGKLVTLRAVRAEDYARFAEWLNDVEVELLSGGSPPRPTTLERVTAMYGARGADSFDFAIEADGNLIGQCGLFEIDRVGSTAEVGITIGDRAYWDKGYGREAMTLLVDYGFRLQNLRKIWLTTLGFNERALKSYLTVGFVEEGRQKDQAWSNGRYVDRILMGLFAKDFLTDRP